MSNLLKIKKNFDDIKDLREDIITIFATLTSKINTLKNLYKLMIKEHKQSECIFGIDSLYFQNKLIQMEYNSMYEIFIAIDNRIYCEYYKLHNIIQNYIKKEMEDENLCSKIIVSMKFPSYKNLEPLKKYDFKLVKQLQEYSLNAITELETYSITKHNELENNTNQSSLGLNIGNLVNSCRYSNALLKEKIHLFCNYLDTFHEHHTKYFNRLKSQLELILKIINEDIKIKQFNQSNKKSEKGENIIYVSK
tara:strand:- start:202 stop:951 length:750 start_codon:yes stop_codon:yes gene_type:complete